MIDFLMLRDFFFIDIYICIYFKWVCFVYYFDFVEDGFGDKKKKKKGWIFFDLDFKLEEY